MKKPLPTPNVRTTFPGIRDRLPLGDTGLRVSPICLGAVGSAELIGAAFDVGVNFFFVGADMHWPMYEPTRAGILELLKRGPEIREQIVIAGASYLTQPEFCHMVFQELLAALPGVERLDILVAGGAYGHEIDRRLPTYQGHRERGFVGSRAIGISFHDRVAAAQQITQRHCDIAFARYNAGHPGGQRDLFPVIAGTQPRPLLYNFNSTTGIPSEKRMRAANMDPDENWFPSPRDGYRLALTEPEVDGLLVALWEQSEVRGLVEALEEGPLSVEEIAYLWELASAVPSPGGPRASP